MKAIVLAAPLYPPEIGGPATDAHSLYQHFNAQGDAPVVVAFSSFRTLPRLVRHFAYFYRLWREALGASCIVAFDTVSVGLPALLAAKLAGVPLVVRVPGDYAWEQAVQRFGVTDSINEFQHKQYGVKTEFLRAIQNLVVRSAQLVVVPSLYFKGVVTGWGVSEKRLNHIYLGIDSSLKPVYPDAVQPKTIFSVGRLVPWKGFAGIIELLGELPSWKLVLAGDGPDAPRLRKLTQELGMVDRVSFIGSIPRAEVLGWCERADAFVLNTGFESFSYQILEAMLQGSRIIATNAGSLPELITSGQEGILYEPGDSEALIRALQSVESDQAQWERYSAAARIKALNFSLDTSTRKFREAILDLCA